MLLFVAFLQNVDHITITVEHFAVNAFAVGTWLTYALHMMRQIIAYVIIE